MGGTWASTACTAMLLRELGAMHKSALEGHGFLGTFCFQLLTARWKGVGSEDSGLSSNPAPAVRTRAIAERQLWPKALAGRSAVLGSALRRSLSGRTRSAVASAMIQSPTATHFVTVLALGSSRNRRGRCFRRS